MTSAAAADRLCRRVSENQAAVLRALVEDRSMRKLLATAAILFMVVSGEALADWHEASSDHFVIYADESEKEIRKYSDRLERYYSAMTTVAPSKRASPVRPIASRCTSCAASESSASSMAAAVTLASCRASIGRAQVASLAIIPPIDAGNAGRATESEMVLLHEYAHHFMFENASYLVPRWYGEGFAEFFATAKFEADGAVGLGLPAEHRAYELLEMRDVSIERLLDSKLYAARKSKDYDNFYGRS